MTAFRVDPSGKVISVVRTVPLNVVVTWGGGGSIWEGDLGGANGALERCHDLDDAWGQ